MPPVPQSASFSMANQVLRVMRCGAKVTKAAVTVVGVGAIGAVGTVIAAGQVKRVRKLPEQVVLSMDITDTQISETGEFESSLHLAKVIEALHYAGDDARVRGLVTCIGSHGTPGLAQVQELRNAVSDFREAKEDTVPTVAFADSFDGGDNSGTRSYYLASAHDQVYAQPTGQLGFTGMSQTTLFVSRMLQSLNIKADVFNREECKGMWRDLVDTGHSKAHRKAIGGLLTSLMSQVVGGVAKDRGLEAYQVTAAVDNAPLTVSDATMRGLLTGVKYRFDACENIRHDRPAFSPKRISYVLPPQASAADSSDVTDSQGSSSCAQTSSTLNSDSQVTAMQPCSQQGSDLGVGGVSQGVLAAVTPWAPVAAASGLMALCAQAIKDNGANKEQPQAVPREDIEEIRRKAKEEEARLAPPGSAYVTSSSGDSRMQKTGCQVITMQHYIKAMEQEKQRAREKAGHGDIWEQPMVLVITAEGRISRGNYRGQGQRVLACDDLCMQLRSAQLTDTVKAVVLRVDSPGGSSVASDAIRHVVMRLRESGIPVVVSMGNQATSGGYEISEPVASCQAAGLFSRAVRVAADRIIAQPGTITGSIGVASGSLKIGRGLKDWGIDVDTVSVGRNAAAADKYTDHLTSAQRQNIDCHVDQTYEAFLEHVSAGRNMDTDEVRSLARGRIWSGQDAFEHGLVDGLGGLSDAITTAKELANLPQDESAVHVHHLNTPNRALPISLQAMLKDAFSSANIFNDTSLGPLLPALQAEVLTFMSQHKAMSDISAPEGPATAVAGRLGLHATYGHAQVDELPHGSDLQMICPTPTRK